MRVQQGFSMDLGNKWRKGDVDVDEVDFARILADADLDVDPASVPRRTKFSIMQAEATILLWGMIYNAGGDKEEVSQNIRQATEEQERGLTRIRESHGG